MYSLIGRLFEGKPLYTVKIPLPSLIFEYDLFLAGALLAVGLFILVEVLIYTKNPNRNMEGLIFLQELKK